MHSSPDTAPPILLWLRRDLRLHDNPALSAAAATGCPVIPVYIHDAVSAARGAAALWRLEKSLTALSPRLAELGSPLVLRKGDALQVLRELIVQTGARSVFWGRDYAPAAIERDKAIKTALKADGLDVQSFPGMLLWEPWHVSTENGGNYRVYSPFWRKARTKPLEEEVPAPSHFQAPAVPIRSDDLAAWNLSHPMSRGADVLAEFALPAGELAAIDRLDLFLGDPLIGYSANRDRLDLTPTSGLSAHLALGEVSPRTIWNRAHAKRDYSERSAEKFLSELAWREFAYHLNYYFPRLDRDNWRSQWDNFAWRDDNSDAEAWRRGKTGVPVIDAAMREMYVTGTMHNRARMIVASYLTKHLLTHWRIGRAWFEDCLVDWDPSSNAMGWQWVAGSGPDAAPFFRIFNPQTQADKFDHNGAYVSRYLPVAGEPLSKTAKAYYDAIPRSWEMSPTDDPAKPRISLADGRARALAAYKDFRTMLDSVA